MATYKPLSPKAQEEAERTTVAYLQTQASKDLVVRFNEAGLKNDKIRSLLREQRDRRVSYDRITGRLKIYSMAPNPLHQAVTEFVSRFISGAMRSGFLTEYEADRVATDNNPIMIRTTTDRPVGKKPMAFSKYADATILFGLPDEDKEPSIVFEVGLSESHEDLLIDARQWLMNTGDSVRLVVLIDIKERRKDLFVKRQSEETQHRRRTLLKSYGNEKARNDNCMSDDETSDDFDSQIPADEKAVFNEMAATIQVDDWVGPVTASVEVWDKGCDGKPRLRDGPVVRFLITLFICILMFHIV